ncbi:MAG: ERCC4 domain-containing protein [Nitrososphaerales archaeon]
MKKQHRVVVDDRERQSGIPDMLTALGLKIDYRRLSVGDYVIPPNTAIERKSLSDLVSSIYDRRIFRQAEELSSNYARAIVLVEGNTSRIRELTDNPRVVYGAIASLVSNFHLSIISTSTPNETALVISSFLNYSLGEKTGALISTPKPRKSPGFPLQQRYLVSALPGIGEKLAEKLLMNFGSPKHVFTATVGDLARIVGRSRAIKIKNVLELESTEYDRKLQAKLTNDE